MGDLASERVRSFILDCLPASFDDDKTVVQSVAFLEKAAGSTLLAFAGPSPQALFKTVHNWILNIRNGRNPDVEKATKSKFIDENKQRITFFLKDKSSKMQGADLLQERLERLKLADKSNTEIKYSEVEEIMAFAWLLKNDDKAALKLIVKKAMASSSAGGAAASGTAGNVSGSAASSASTPSPASKKSTDAKALVRALFSK